MKLFPDTYCLICHEIILNPIGWSAIFSEEKEQFLCKTCEMRFEKIEGETCQICGRMLCYLDEGFRQGKLCNDCIRWEEDEQWSGYLEANHSIFLYNDFLKEVLAKYKFRGDYVLAKIFVVYLKVFMQKIKPDLLVPIPLSEERLYERGFNQAEALILESGFTSTRLLSRIHSEKQSKKSRMERIHIPQVFQVNPQVELKGKAILLIDDIYTTGSTLRHAAKLLKESGAEKIQSLTLAR
jgi:competence protein ComFC